jgi:DNA repair protein RecN (Recombination protein N)
MLRFLRIRNLAVIEHAEVEFGPGLNVLTGETGAGKSMLVDAVSLLLGARASGDLVRTGETLATIEALFETREGIEIVVRREVTSQGRSRAYLDGQLATVAAVREAAGALFELHGQHERQVARQNRQNRSGNRSRRSGTALSPECVREMGNGVAKNADDQWGYTAYARRS